MLTPQVIGSPLTLMVERPPVLASTKVAGKSRGETLFAVASAIANMGINWAFHEWLGYFFAQEAVLDVIRAAAYAILHVDIRWSFNTWMAECAHHGDCAHAPLAPRP